ncbi:ATP-binding protein [Nostoc sp. DSM 114167]|jgi:hypothetical protein|uniref:ATP-binding protein n=1 Tax=Nostoc sp. DSM 114167 TaxID=3439050 RepID=UPI0040459AA4
MQEIEQFNQKLKSQRRTATFFVGSLVVAGLSLTLPLWNDSVKWEETLYCFQQTKKPCKEENFKRGVSWIIESERRNFLFNESIKIIRILPPEDNTAMLYGMLGTSALLAAWGVSKNLTNKQEEAIHSQFSMLKIKAIENDIIAGNHLDLTKFSKAQQSEITKSAIARHTSETIDQMKSPGELAMDEINGRLQGEIALKSHELNLSELDKQIADNRLTTAEATKKLDKLQGEKVNDKSDSHTSSSQQLKNNIVDALKNHEDGWLWKVIDNQKPIWVLGEAGSGKSTLAASIVMLRQYLFDMPLYQLIDAHAGDNLRKAWKYLNPQFVAQSEEEISGAFDDARERWLDRINNQVDKKQQQLLVDEFTNYSDSDITKQPARKFVKASLSDPRKAEERLVCIAHFFTNTATGGDSGSAKGRARGTIQIDRKTADGKIPLDMAVINGLNNFEGDAEVDKKVKIPGWLAPKNINDHFNGKTINFDS